MDIEFHYHMTYLISAMAGYRPEEATIIAYSCQYPDDNIHTLVIDEKNAELRYENYYSQTYDSTKAKDELLRVYCLFHFMPGDPQSPSTYRTDGLMHWLNTTPGSQNAADMLDMALADDWFAWTPTFFSDDYHWKNPQGYQQSHWFLFQEAIKEHQHDMSTMLHGRNLKGLSLPGW